MCGFNDPDAAKRAAVNMPSPEEREALAKLWHLMNAAAINAIRCRMS